MKIRHCIIDVRYEATKAQEKALMWLAWRTPRKLAYWTAIRVIAHGTTGRFSGQIVPDLTAMDALKRWEMR